MSPRLPEAFLTTPITHRGLHDVKDGRPENSRAAFAAAIEHGFGIELDVQLTADAQPLVFHDYGLKRLTGVDGVVQRKTAQAMASLPLLGGEDHAQTLADVLEFVAGRVPVLVEIKDQDGAMGENIGALEAACAQAISGYSGAIAVMSFNPHTTKRMGELCPNIPRGLVTSAYNPEDWPLPLSVCKRLRDIPDFDESGSSFISHEAKDLGRPRVADLKDQGANILCWTIKSQQMADDALKIADNITFEQFIPA